jgi:hypothetical protein
MRRAWSVGLAVVACGLLILFVQRVGPRVVIEQCLTLGRVLPAILALTFCKYPLLRAALLKPYVPVSAAVATGAASQGYASRTTQY